MPLFLIAIISYAVYFYLIMRLDKKSAWVYIGAVVGVPVFVVAVALFLSACGLYIDLDQDNIAGECVKWEWATGECSKTIIP